MSFKIDLHHERKNYDKHSLLEASVLKNPFEQFAFWYKEATEEEKIIEPNVVTLATATVNAKPSVRIVLLKEFSPSGFVFYTNYNSKKGKELTQNPQASLLFFWDVLERQVRIEGVVKKVAPAQSDEYFKSRPVESRLGAIASPQSQVITSREVIEEKIGAIRNQQSEDEIERPEYWGGYILIPDYFEFWQGRPNRVHDRLSFTKQGDSWGMNRLAP